MAIIPPSTLNILHIDNKCFNSNVHKINWRKSILQQLQLRKTIEQNQFQEICSFAGNMFDRVDICKSENIQLNLKCENLQQQLLGIQQTLLAGGSAAAKTVLSKLSSSFSSDQANTGSNPSGANHDPVLSTAINENFSQYGSLLAEKSQLEKKILDLQEKLANVLSEKSVTTQKLKDLRTENDDKDEHNRQLEADLKMRHREMEELKKTLKELDDRYKTLDDEHTALKMAYKSLEKRHQTLLSDFDKLKEQILMLKHAESERLNAENDRITAMQREKQRLKIEANVNEMTNVQLAKQAAGDPSALALEAMNRGDNFEMLEDDQFNLCCPSRLPNASCHLFETNHGETYALNWYCRASPKDSYLATGGNDRKIKVWKVGADNCTSVATLLGSNASITSIDIEADFILASSNDFAARLWAMDTYRPKQTLTGHSAKVYTAKFLGEKTKVASGSQDRTIKIWDVYRGASLKTYFAGSSCYDIVYNNQQLTSCHFDSKIRCWALGQSDNNEPITLISLQDRITSLDVSSDGWKLLCSVRDNTIKLLDIRKLDVIQTYSDEKFKVGTEFVRAKFSVDGQYISCGSQDGSLYIWNTNTAKVERILSGHSTSVVASSWSPDGEKVVSIDKGGRVNIWA